MSGESGAKLILPFECSVRSTWRSSDLWLVIVNFLAGTLFGKRWLFLAPKTMKIHQIANHKSQIYIFTDSLLLHKANGIMNACKTKTHFGNDNYEGYIGYR